MKMSEMYKELQRLVLFYSGCNLTGDERLEMLKELMKQEDLARFKEEHEELEALE